MALTNRQCRGKLCDGKCGAAACPVKAQKVPSSEELKDVKPKKLLIAKLPKHVPDLTESEAAKAQRKQDKEMMLRDDGDTESVGAKHHIAKRPDSIKKTARLQVEEDESKARAKRLKEAINTRY